ncbi:sensor histidine kinase (plasmid) [Streptomyces sp. BI20]|uniref:sensor histidine kinase n=1 Tax=Streptomyces sp. BI20 TaxID=3403460 RepID=UPI003C7935D3
MSTVLQAAFRPLTYTRWVHLCVPLLLLAVWMYIQPAWPWMPLLIVIPFAFLPWVRLAEGTQARFLLTSCDRHSDESGITVAPSTRWPDRWRTLLWLELRLVVGGVAGALTVWLPLVTVELAAIGFGHPFGGESVLPLLPPRWLALPLALLPPVLLVLSVILLGDLITGVARLLLGPSTGERLTALEARTEQLLERTRIARELHDSIGHALTVAVLQAGAARASGDPEFTDRALGAIEETGRAALEDLERVLRVLRETPADGRPSGRPTLAEAERLWQSARAAGAEVDVTLDGATADLPGPVTREGYRILQEALTNVLRHNGPVPITVRLAAGSEELLLEVCNPLPDEPRLTTGGGSGLRGIRERAALLGGEAETGPHGTGWRVRVRLPVDRIR